MQIIKESLQIVTGNSVQGRKLEKGNEGQVSQQLCEPTQFPSQLLAKGGGRERMCHLDFYLG